MALPKPPLKPATRLDMTDIPTPKVRRARKSATKTAQEVTSTDTPTQTIEAVTPQTVTAVKTATAAVETQVEPPKEKTYSKKTAAKQVAAVPHKIAARKAGKRAATKQTAPAKSASTTEAHKLFILDTNVMLHDPTCLFRFQEHDIFLPMMALEELRHEKSGLTEVVRNALQVSRTLDSLVRDHEDLTQGIPLNILGNK